MRSTPIPRWPTAGIDAVVTKPIKASPLHAALATVLRATLDDGGEQARRARIDPSLGEQASAPDPAGRGQRR